MNEDFIPYFVVYRYIDNQFDVSLHMKSFMTLFELYAFIGKNAEHWSEYTVGRALETFKNR